MARDFYGAMNSYETERSAPADQQDAAGSPYQIRPNQDGSHSVINVNTGQVHFTGPPSAASSAQATLNYRNR